MNTYTKIKAMPGFNKKVLLGALLAAGMVMGAGSTQAATTTSTLTVTATLTSACILTGGTLAFGAYSGNQLDAASNTSITCTLATPWSITAATRDTAAGWQLTSVGPTGVYYDLYTTTGRTIQLSDGTTGTPITGTGTGAADAAGAIIYGRIAANQNFTIANAGAATDTLVLTVTY
jgi:spore coat protein U-like protein